MMGHHPPPNDPLFSYKVQLETRIRKDHPLRKIKELVDFDFIYKEVEKTYGMNGNVSVPPPVILKLIFDSCRRGQLRNPLQLFNCCLDKLGISQYHGANT